MTLAAGTRLGPYEIVAPIGAGGMGEVYRARDPRIGRDVAIKVLPAAFSSDAERLRRFEQEARSAGLLNHPNIVAIYDVGSHEGEPYVVSELLEGESLRERLALGALPARKAMEIAVAVAGGLAAAHERGIVHRDLKPDNLFLTRDGRVKILDFGIAKLTGDRPPDPVTTSAATVTADTRAGTVWGTVGYMSPEQVRGLPVDHRSDLFSFGAILYEMLSGRRAFQGDTTADTITAILKEDPPDLEERSDAIPPALARIVRHCLEKTPGERFQSARDLAFNIEAISGASGSRPAQAMAPPRKRRTVAIPLAVLYGIGVGAAALGLAYHVMRPQAGAPMRLTVEPPVMTPSQGIVYEMSISPSGAAVAFGVVDSSGALQLWIRRLGGTSAQRIPGTEDGVGAFWSPDSRYLGFFAKGKLKRVPTDGGLVEDLCDAPDPRGGTWGRSGVIVFASGSSGGLSQVPTSGGDPNPATTLDSTKHETAHRWPCFLPDGRHFLYLTLPGRDSQFDTFVGSLTSKPPKQILRSSRAAVYADPGYLLFSRGDVLMAQRFSPRSLKLDGEPSPVAEVPLGFGAVAVPIVSAARNGVAVYMSQRVGDTTVGWYSMNGTQLSTIPVPGGRYEGLQLSPDGKRAIVTRRESHANRDLWLVELSSGAMTRLTSDPGADDNPVWSPDGSQIVFRSNRDGGVGNFYITNVDGAGEKLLYRPNAQWAYPFEWSRDGRYIVFGCVDPSRRGDLWLLPMFGDRKAIPYLVTQYDEGLSAISPDGHWLAYVSDETGRREVYVRSFPVPGRSRRVSRNGGNYPGWDTGGKALIFGRFVHGGVEALSVAVREDASSFEAGAETGLGSWPPTLARRCIATSGSPPLKRILALMLPEEEVPVTPALIVNWPSLVREKR